MNARKIIAGLAISATAIIGTAGVASAADGTAHPAKQARIEQACAKAPTLEQKMNDHKTKIQDRITKLTDAKAKADAAGHAEFSFKVPDDLGGAVVPERVIGLWSGRQRSRDLAVGREDIVDALDDLRVTHTQGLVRWLEGEGVAAVGGALILHGQPLEALAGVGRHAQGRRPRDVHCRHV